MERTKEEDSKEQHDSSAVEVNESGHVQELEHKFSLLSLVGLALNVGSVWPAAAVSILVAIANGGVSKTIPRRVLADIVGLVARRHLRVHRRVPAVCAQCLLLKARGSHHLA